MVQLLDIDDGTSRFAPEDVDKGYFLFSIVKKYNLNWSIHGVAIPSGGEIGMASYMTSLDKLQIPPVSDYKQLNPINAHLDLPMEILENMNKALLTYMREFSVPIFRQG